MSECDHAREVLLGMDCGAGGVQYRYYCMACWRAGAAIPHPKALELCRGVPMMADRDLIDKARTAYWQQGRRHEDQQLF